MAQTSDPMKTLKQALKSHGETYAAVTRELGLSEASVKRLAECPELADCLR